MSNLGNNGSSVERQILSVQLNYNTAGKTLVTMDSQLKDKSWALN